MRTLGHRVLERDPRYPKDTVAQVAVRMLRGVHEDIREMPHPERLERRVRTLGRAGGAIPQACVRLIRRREAALAASLNVVLQRHEIILTPGPLSGPWTVGEMAGKGALATLSACAEAAPFQGLVNAAGHPACSIPAGFDEDGVPVAVQLIGRSDDHVTLLRLSAQLEAARPWAQPPGGLKAGE